MSTICLLLLVSFTPSAPADTVVVCPEQFRTALQPWLEHRQAQGHQIRILSNRGTPAQIRASIREVARDKRLRFVLLVGDVAARSDRDPAAPLRSVPTQLAPARVNTKWGSEPEICTDNGYADLDDDQVPDVAIGRLTVNTAEELTGVVRKILRYERSTDMGRWRSRVNLVAGTGGFGPVLDRVLETVCKKFITDGIPAAYPTSMTYASWRSPYCPAPRDFHLHTLDRLNEGCLIWAYLGHGMHTELDRVRTPARAFRIFDIDDVQKLDCRGGLPVAMFLSCYTGAFDQPYESLGEKMLKHPGAPVAIVCGSRVTMPYGMAVMATATMDELFRQRHATWGEVLLHGKRRMVVGEQPGANRQLLDTLAGSLSPAPEELPVELHEHVLMFHLLGDPLLRVPYPKQVELALPKYAFSGDSLLVSGDSPIGGTATVELVCRRDRLVFSPSAAAPVGTLRCHSGDHERGV